MPRVPLLLAAAALLACAPEDSARWATGDNAIIGGNPAGASEQPSAGAMLVRLRNDAEEFVGLGCSGTLIAPDVVLTAAHCVDNPFGPNVTIEFFFSFALDVSSVEQTGRLPADAVDVRRAVGHPNFDLDAIEPGLGNLHDVGLLFLARPVRNVEPAVMVEVDDGGQMRVGSSVIIAGYGVTEPEGDQAGVKHVARSLINETVPAEMQIGDRAPLAQKCHGDSGGPSYIGISDGKLPVSRVAGVTSRAYDDSDCYRGGIDMRVDFFRAWITEQMVDACNNGTRVACENGGRPRDPTSGLPPPPDAGVLDTGLVVPDATTPIRADASTIDPPDAGTPPAPKTFELLTAKPVGCGCASTRSGRGPIGPPLAIAILIAAALLTRRQS